MVQMAEKFDVVELQKNKYDFSIDPQNPSQV